MAHANIDYHMDFFSLLLLTHGTGEPVPENYQASMNTDSRTPAAVQRDKVSNGGLHNHCYHPPQAFPDPDCLVPDNKENNGTVNGFFHSTSNVFPQSSTANGFNKVDCRHGTKRIRGDLQNGTMESETLCTNKEPASHLTEFGVPSKRHCSEESGCRIHQLLPLDDHLPSIEDSSSEMTSEPSCNGGSLSVTYDTSLCSQCGRKKHKKFCTGYMEEMMYCSQMDTASSLALMPCAQCLSGQSGHLDHISQASSVVMDTS